MAHGNAAGAVALPAGGEPSPQDDYDERRGDADQHPSCPTADSGAPVGERCDRGDLERELDGEVACSQGSQGSYVPER
jgi:hypothetical protein